MVYFMARRAKEAGPSSQHVAANVRRLRRERKLSTVALSQRLAEIGHPIASTGITKIELGDRRVDVDDLVALATALDTTPSRLLLPEVEADRTKAAPRRADDGWLPPLEPDRLADARPYADAIYADLRRWTAEYAREHLDVSPEDIPEPVGADLFGEDTPDARTWDVRADLMSARERVWLI